MRVERTFPTVCVQDGALQLGDVRLVRICDYRCGCSVQPRVIMTPPHVQREADSKRDSTLATGELLFLTHEKNDECKNRRPLTKSSHQSGENAAFLFTAAVSLSFAALIHSAPLIELSRQIVP